MLLFLIAKNKSYYAGNYIKFAGLSANTKYLVTPYWKTESFAGKLKEVASLILNCDVKDLESEDFKNKTVMTSYHLTLNGDIISNAYNTMEEAVERLNERMLFDRETKGLSIDNYQVKKVNITPRLLLTAIGTDIVKKINPMIWINSLMNKYNPNLHNWIITDVRFEDEVKAVKTNKGIIIRVNRRTVEDSKTAHISETALDNYKGFDFTIDNNSSKTELLTKVTEIYNQIKHLL